MQQPEPQALPSVGWRGPPTPAPGARARPPVHCWTKRSYSAPCSPGTMVQPSYLNVTLGVERRVHAGQRGGREAEPRRPRAPRMPEAASPDDGRAVVAHQVVRRPASLLVDLGGHGWVLREPPSAPQAAAAIRGRGERRARTPLPLRTERARGPGPRPPHPPQPLAVREADAPPATLPIGGSRLGAGRPRCPCPIPAPVGCAIGRGGGAGRSCARWLSVLPGASPPPLLSPGPRAPGAPSLSLALLLPSPAPGCSAFRPLRSRLLLLASPSLCLLASPSALPEPTQNPFCPSSSPPFSSPHLISQAAGPRAPYGDTFKGATAPTPVQGFSLWGRN